jgi:hypothetical protein
MLVISCRHMNAIAASSKLAPLTCNESKSEPETLRFLTSLKIHCT